MTRKIRKYKAKTTAILINLDARGYPRQLVAEKLGFEDSPNVISMAKSPNDKFEIPIVKVKPLSEMAGLGNMEILGLAKDYFHTDDGRPKKCEIDFETLVFFMGCAVKEMKERRDGRR